MTFVTETHTNAPCCLKKAKIIIYKTILLPVVLCCFEIWSLILMVEDGVRVFENRYLRMTIGTRRDEEAVGWKLLCNEELHDL
jgi:hypothetical protein